MFNRATDDDHDVCIVGGGIAGAAAAAACAATGASTVLCEQEPTLAAHTTGRSAAMFLEAYGSPVNRELTVASRAWFESGGVDGEALLTPLPMLTIARSDQLDALEAAAQQGAADGLCLEHLGPAEARAAFELLRPGHVAAALLDDTSCEVDVAATVRRFVHEARAGGAVVRTSARAVTFDPVSGRWRIETADGELVARVVLNAAGAWADDVAARCGVAQVGLEPRRRTACTVALPAGFDASQLPFVLDVDEQFYLKPEGPHLLISPADATPVAAGDARHEPVDVAVALDRVNEAIDLPTRHVRSAWAGLRTFAPDGDPVVGPDPAQPTFVWLAGQGGTGIQTAPALAALAADAVSAALGQRRAPLPDSLAAAAQRLRPDRTMTMEVAR